MEFTRRDVLKAFGVTAVSSVVPDVLASQSEQIWDESTNNFDFSDNDPIRITPLEVSAEVEAVSIPITNLGYTFRRATMEYRAKITAVLDMPIANKIRDKSAERRPVKLILKVSDGDIIIDGIVDDFNCILNGPDQLSIMSIYLLSSDVRVT